MNLMYGKQKRAISVLCSRVSTVFGLCIRDLSIACRFVYFFVPDGCPDTLGHNRVF